MKIEIQSLAFAYGREAVFQGVTLALEQSRILSILGPNGAGKTTLLSVIAGLLPATAGEIHYDGKRYDELSPRQLAQMVGYVPQIINATFDFAVVDYVVTGCAPRVGSFSRPKKEHYDTAMAAIEEMGISHLAHKSYMQISGGERQQVSIARVIAQRPAFILMDEPTAHLDYGNQIHVLKTIKRLCGEGFGMIFTTHNPDHALLLDGDVAVMDRLGTLHTGNREKLLDEAFLTDLYRTELRIEHMADGMRDVCFPPGLE
ncbi:ABC transporter ATP-binding protein [Eubacteriales bacterium OttesenSCG-928-M02]|nr:ABC transporter ATP-binding protein [Eubacteriales bacterium OttesenSCG-928-M02]